MADETRHPLSRGHEDSTGVQDDNRFRDEGLRGEPWLSGPGVSASAPDAEPHSDAEPYGEASAYHDAPYDAGFYYGIQDNGEMSVGEILRRTRESYGQDLRYVAESLRIRYVYLQAIEEGRMDDLPGQTYEIGFVRSYAEYLGLEAEEVVRRYKEERRGIERRQSLHFPAPVSEGKVPSGAILLISLLLVGLAYGGWTYLSSQERSFAEMIPEVPERLRGLVASEETAEIAEAPEEGEAWSAAFETEQTAAANDTASTGDAPALDVEAGETVETRSLAQNSAPEEQSGASAPVETFDPALDGGEREEAESAAEDTVPEDGQGSPTNSESLAVDASPATAEAPPAAPDNGFPEENGLAEEGDAAAPAQEDALAAAEAEAIPAAPTGAQRASLHEEALARQPEPLQIYGETDGPSRIELRATQDSWVQIRDGSDTLVLTRVLRAGEAYRVPDEAGFTMLTGNAGGLRITVDGQTIPALGPVGAVRRDVALDPESLLGQTAASVN